MELRRMRLARRGQMRIVEALLSCLVIVLGFMISAYFSNSYLGVRRGEMEVVSINVAGLVGSQSLLEKVLNQTGSWQQDLKSCLESLLPANTFYELKVYSMRQDKEIANVTNVYGANMTAGMNTASARRVITVTLPMGRNESKKLDVVLILDRSGSMDQSIPGDPHNKIYYLKEASKYFVDRLDMSMTIVGMASFSTDATLDVHLTNNKTAVKEAIDRLTPTSATNMGGAIELTVEEFNQNRRSESTWTAILISDGRANIDRNGVYNFPGGRQYAAEEANDLSALGVHIYTIGLGNNTADFDEELLKEIQTDGYYYAPSAQELDEIYELIISDIFYRVRFDVVVLELTVMRPGTFD